MDNEAAISIVGNETEIKPCDADVALAHDQCNPGALEPDMNAPRVQQSARESVLFHSNFNVCLRIRLTWANVCSSFTQVQQSARESVPSAAVVGTPMDTDEDEISLVENDAEIKPRIADTLSQNNGAGEPEINAARVPLSARESPPDAEVSDTAMNNEETVVLVVGNESERKKCVADALGQRRGASESEINLARVRLFARESVPDAVVVDTVPLFRKDGEKIADAASRWISQNSLRRMLGQSIFVVCTFVVTPLDRNIKDKFKEWVQLLSIIFEEHKSALMMLVDDAAASQIEMIVNVLDRKGFPKTNVTFANLTGSGDVGRMVEPEIRFRGELPGTTIAPFALKEVSRNEPSNTDHSFNPWGLERVILIGRTGSGKSTLAQMLTLGKLDPSCKDFVTSSQIRGETKEVVDGQGRGWYVVDTPGLGVPPQEQYVSTTQAQKLIKKHVKQIEGIYSHFLYVMKNNRIDQLDVKLWRIFVQLFDEDIRDHFTIVISNADQRWVTNNTAHLERSFTGCKSFLSAYFPPIKPHDEGPESDDDEVEAELQRERTKSLKELEDGLASFARSPKTCVSRAVPANFLAGSGTGLRCSIF